jgi:thioredoxin 1
MEGKPKEIRDNEFPEEVLNAGSPVLVDFWAPWCGPCRMVGPVLEEVAKDYDGKVKVGKVNVDDNNDTATRYGIMSIPTMLIFKGGEPVETIIGFRKKEDLNSLLDKYL